MPHLEPIHYLSVVEIGVIHGVSSMRTQSDRQMFENVPRAHRCRSQLICSSWGPVENFLATVFLAKKKTKRRLNQVRGLVAFVMSLAALPANASNRWDRTAFQRRRTP